MHSWYLRRFPIVSARPSFRPTDISGLALWLDAADASTITVDGSNNVSEWRDKSTNARHLTQVTVLNRPGWSAADGVAFTSAGHQLVNATSVNSVSPITAFVAFRCTETASYGTTSGNDTFLKFGGWQFQTASSVFWGRYSITKSAVASRFTTMSQIATTDRIYRAAARSTGVLMRVIGATTQNETLAAMTGGSPDAISVGTFPRGNMVIREALFYAAELTDEQISFVESYLSAKWGTI
jgi:hypothetical protein